jgi:formylglycine-generating enzyme required for sulfatase activity
MGSPVTDEDADDDERPQHHVEITEGFYIGIYPVTQSQHERVCPTDYRLQTERANFPIVNVSWFDAIGFCNELSKLEGLLPFYGVEADSVSMEHGEGYRLPTEAEWEYACRAGTTTAWSYGEDMTRMEDFGWCECNASQPVGGKHPNAWGIYDMHGNVWEWCWDWYAPYMEYVMSRVQRDPIGPSTGESRVIRGGSFFFEAWNARSAYRIGERPSTRSDTIGFRIVRTYC